MKRSCLIFFTIFGLAISAAGCGGAACKVTNPVFDAYAANTKEYKDELVRQLSKVDQSELTYTLEAFQADSNAQYIYVHIRGESLCAEACLTLSSSNKGIEDVIKNKGVGYRGAELLNLKFDIKQDSTSTAFIFHEISGIID